MPLPSPISWTGQAAAIVDQRLLPAKVVTENLTTIEQVHQAIHLLKVRGAPVIGITAALGLYLGVRDFPGQGDRKEFLSLLERQANYLKSARPTAVNLAWAVDRCLAGATDQERKSVQEMQEDLLAEAILIREEDRQTCQRIGEHGFELLKRCDSLLTHRNTGVLATAGLGTALAVAYVGKERGKLFRVYANETRPLLQGARLTALELHEAGIPVTLLCDSAAATLMARNTVDAVVVGADRIAANGDVANKIGTYMVALAARAHGIPFYVAAPFSTFDLSISNGADIPIEERGSEEVTTSGGQQRSAEGVEVYNPAFDVTPHDFITGIITEGGIITPPYKEGIMEMFDEQPAKP